MSGYRGHGWRRGGALDELDVGDGRVCARAAHGVHGHGRKVSGMTVPVSSGRGVMLGRGSAWRGREGGMVQITTALPRHGHSADHGDVRTARPVPLLPPPSPINSSMQGVRKEVRELG